MVWLEQAESSSSYLACVPGAEASLAFKEIGGQVMKIKHSYLITDREEFIWRVVLYQMHRDIPILTPKFMFEINLN